MGGNLFLSVAKYVPHRTFIGRNEYRFFPAIILKADNNLGLTIRIPNFEGTGEMNFRTTFQSF
jgi:hypothetical protein